jgi:hypothetical protein
VIVPVLVHYTGGLAEFSVCKRLVDLLGCYSELVKNPALGQRLPARHLATFAGHEVLIKFAEYVFCGLVNLIAEFSVAIDDFDIEVDVAAYFTR